MSKLDEILKDLPGDHAVYFEPHEEAKQAIKTLMLEIAKSCEENWGNGTPLIDPEKFKEKVSEL